MPNGGAAAPSEIVDFWRDAGPARWFTRDDGFDAEITTRFLSTWQSAASNTLGSWLDRDDTAALALILVLDQFPRNMFRNDARAFATDALARDAADCAIRNGTDQRVETAMRQFIYMPFMHSEASADQARCVDLFRDTGSAENVRFAEIHADIIARFGRFPHRNRALGRVTTSGEQAFLDAGGFAG